MLLYLIYYFYYWFYFFFFVLKVYRFKRNDKRIIIFNYDIYYINLVVIIEVYVICIYYYLLVNVYKEKYGSFNVKNIVILIVNLKNVRFIIVRIILVC